MKLNSVTGPKLLNNLQNILKICTINLRKDMPIQRFIFWSEIYCIAVKRLGGIITIVGQDGKPTQVAASALQAQIQQQNAAGT